VAAIEPLEPRRFLSTTVSHTLHPPVEAALAPEVAKHATTSLSANFQRAVEAVKERYHIPRVVVGVAGRNGTIWQAAIGKGDVESGAPVTLDEHFSIRSITKSFTVTLILQLAREKKLSLNDPIEKYFPGIPNGKEITLTQLAAMESG